MTELEKIKIRLGITHTLKDEAIQEDMETARLEMIRSGVSSAAIAENGSLVRKAVETYILMLYSDPSLMEQYQNSFDYQVNNLRKSSGFMEGDDYV